MATRWSWSDQMACAYSRAKVRANRIYMRDGNCYLSTGQCRHRYRSCVAYANDLEGRETAITELVPFFCGVLRFCAGYYNTLRPTVFKSSDQRPLIWYGRSYSGKPFCTLFSPACCHESINFARHPPSIAWDAPGNPRLSSAHRSGSEASRVRRGTSEEVAQQRGFEARKTQGCTMTVGSIRHRFSTNEVSLLLRLAVIL